eukprot:6197414-Pleurochrysis_carterae.AAC.1
MRLNQRAFFTSNWRRDCDQQPSFVCACLAVARFGAIKLYAALFAPGRAFSGPHFGGTVTARRRLHEDSSKSKDDLRQTLGHWQAFMGLWEITYDLNSRDTHALRLLKVPDEFRLFPGRFHFCCCVSSQGLGRVAGKVTRFS